MTGLGRAATALVAGALMAVPTGGSAQDDGVRLSARNGGTTLSGTLLAYEDGIYRINVPGLGELEISGTNVTCEGDACPAADYGLEFGIHGSRTVGTTLIPTLLGGYAESFGGRFEIEATDDPAARIGRLYDAAGDLRAEIDLQTRGSGSAFAALAEDAAALGLADRRMNDTDLEDEFEPAGLPDLRDTENEIVLGVDGIVLITHPDNPVPNLTSDEVARIFSGEITNWQELGGGDHAVTVNSFGEGSGDRATLLDGLVRPEGREEKEDVIRWSDYQDMVDAVMAERGGIGYVGRWLASTSDVNQLAIREECGLLSPPTDFRMKIEGYSLSRRLYAYKRPGEIHPEARAFLDWALTDEAQPYIAKANFVDRDLERMRLEDMGMALIHTAAVEPDFNGDQFAAMMRDLRNADRLSVSFRFRTGSSALDVESVRSLRELAERMETGEFDGQEMILVGFADSVGNAVGNTALALDRAVAVQRILEESVNPEVRERLALRPVSYGELMPLSCNTTDVGRERNRRVEIWLKVPESRNATN